MSVPDQRATVFGRIREALRQPAPHRHAHDAAHDDPGENAIVEPTPGSDAFRKWLPLVGPTLDEQIALFAQNSVTLKTDFRSAASLDEAATQLIALAVENNWKRIATHQHPQASGLAEKLGLPCQRIEADYSRTELEQCDAGITGCDSLVAQTGSVLVTSVSTGGRALSVLPPHHVVIARRSQVVPDLTAALQLARETYAPNWPSFLSFITGPSRTGDIERILVLGAHGPKKLTIFLVP